MADVLQIEEEERADEFVDDIEIPFPGEVSRLKNLKETIAQNKKVLLGVGVIVVVLVVITVIACTATLVPVLILTTGDNDSNNSNNNNNHGGNPPPPQIIDDGEYEDNYPIDPMIDCCLDDFPYHTRIWNTIEYQIGLNDLSSFKDREKMINKYLSSFDSLSKLDFKYSNGNESVREEYDLKTLNCHSTVEVRVRKYVTGPRAGFTTVDSKMNGKSQSEVLNFPLYPSHDQFPTSYQKAEKDQHECDSKYARETRCTLPSPFSFETCQDVMNLYPGIYPHIGDDVRQKTVSAGSTKYWYVMEHATFNFPTTLKNGTTVYSKLDSTFTLEYSTLDQAESGDAAPYYGEWSFRLYAQEVGPDVPWIPEVPDAGLSIYNSMVSTYENSKC